MPTTLPIVPKSRRFQKSRRSRNRILFGVLVRRPAEDFKRDDGFFQFVSSTSQLLFDYKPKKLGEALILGKSRTRKDALQLIPDGACCGPDFVHHLENTFCFQANARA
jgi:hypothetical protein